MCVYLWRGMHASVLQVHLSFSDESVAAYLTRMKATVIDHAYAVINMSVGEGNGARVGSPSPKTDNRLHRFALSLLFVELRHSSGVYICGYVYAVGACVWSDALCCEVLRGRVCVCVCVCGGGGGGGVEGTATLPALLEGQEAAVPSNCQPSKYQQRSNH